MTDILITERLRPPEIHDAYSGTVEILNSDHVDVAPNLMPFMIREIDKNMNKKEMVSLVMSIYKLMLRRLLGFY